MLISKIVPNIKKRMLITNPSITEVKINQNTGFFDPIPFIKKYMLNTINGSWIGSRSGASSNFLINNGSFAKIATGIKPIKVFLIINLEIKINPITDKKFNNIGIVIGLSNIRIDKDTIYRPSGG